MSCVHCAQYISSSLYKTERIWRFRLIVIDSALRKRPRDGESLTVCIDTNVRSPCVFKTFTSLGSISNASHFSAALFAFRLVRIYPITMQTRRRKTTETAEPVEEAKTVSKKTPKKQKTDALVSILDEIKEENAAAKSATEDGAAKPAAAEKPIQLQKTLRGKPKSGRPWKDVKQK